MVGAIVMIALGVLLWWLVTQVPSDEMFLKLMASFFSGANILVGACVIIELLT